MDLRETVELIGITAEEPTEDNLVEISASESVSDDKEEAMEKNSARKQADIRQSGRRVPITQVCF